MYLDWLPDILRDAGLDIEVMAGAERRGRSLSRINGIVWHSTVTGTNWTDRRVAELLRDGHANLAGPLAQLGPARSGKIWIPALGRCNHNGYGLWGNDSIALEFFNDGYAPFPEAQVEAGATATAAILRHLGKGIEFVKGHKETDPRRKIDPPVNMNTVRHIIATKLTSTKELFTVGQYEDIKAQLDRIEAGLWSTAVKVEGVAQRQVPKATVQEAIRDLRRIGIKVEADIEGPDPDGSIDGQRPL